MKAYIQLVWAQLLLYARNKNTVIWSIILPVFMILALGMFMREGGNSFSLHFGVIDLDHSASSEQFVRELREIKGLKLESGESDELMSQLKNGDLNGVILLKKGFHEALTKEESSGTQAVELHVSQSQLTVAQIASQLIMQKIDEFNKRFTQFEPRVTLKIDYVQTQTLSYIDFLVPGILSLMIMSNNLNGVAATIASWRERGILRKMQSTPLTSSAFIAGQMTARILLAFLQALVVVLISHWVFDVQVIGSWWLLLGFIFLGTLTFMSIGFIVASLAKSPESASPIAGFISFPMIFVGGIFFPIRDLPGILQPIVKAIPIGYLTEALRGVMNEGLGITELWVPSLVLLAWTVASFTVAALTFRWDVK